MITFLLQASLFPSSRLPLALMALGMGTFYSLLAWGAHKRAPRRVFAQGYTTLALAFFTLTIPLSLPVKAAAAVFALEGLGLLWFGFTRQHRLMRWLGLALQLAAAGIFVVGALGHP